jgi:cGMP-dependent protein kinase
MTTLTKMSCSVTPKLLKTIAGKPNLVAHQARVLFGQFDDARKGVLVEDEFRSVLVAVHASLGMMPPNDRMIEQASDEFADDSQGGVTTTEFIRWFSSFVDVAQPATTNGHLPAEPATSNGHVPGKYGISSPSLPSSGEKRAMKFTRQASNDSTISFGVEELIEFQVTKANSSGSNSSPSRNNAKSSSGRTFKPELSIFTRDISQTVFEEETSGADDGVTASVRAPAATPASSSSPHKLATPQSCKSQHAESVVSEDRSLYKFVRGSTMHNIPWHVSYYSWISDSCLSCWEGLYAKFWPGDAMVERANFERTVMFLGSVPLFQKQLPRSELPFIAKVLRRTKWRPGDVLVNEGENGKAFFLIESGEVKATTQDANGKESVRTSLYAGDFFGGHTLQQTRPNVASMTAVRPTVTLSLSKDEFERAGMKDRLVFPKRPAIYNNIKDKVLPRSDFNACVTSQDDLQFIEEAIGRNPNLHGVSEDKAVVAKMARTATRRMVPAGENVAKVGDIGEEFFVIASGSFDVLVNTAEETSGQRSAESCIARSTMAERLIRRQAFHRDLVQPAPQVTSPSNLSSRRRSVSVNFSAGIDNERTPLRKGKRNFTREAFASTDGTEDPSVPRRPTKGYAINSRRSLTFLGDNRQREARRRNLTMTSDQSPDEQQTFEAGDLVTCVIPGEAEEGLGEVQRIMKGGIVEVLFGQICRRVDCSLLQKAEDPDVITTLHRKDSFGELSLMYNYRREATFVAKEDSEVFVINRSDFRGLFERRGHQEHENYVSLLQEVELLCHLMKAELIELASNALNHVTFAPGERILTQGRKREAKLWYVIDHGCAIMSRNSEDGSYYGHETYTLAELYRGNCFGERSLLRGDDCTECNVDAGPSGMTCLTFDGEVVKQTLMRCVADADKGIGVQRGIEAWAANKNRQRTNWHSQLTLNSLEQVCVLGSGAFATVTLVQARKDDISPRLKKKHRYFASVEEMEEETCVQFALKRMSKGHIERMRMTEQVCWEKDLLSMVDSQFVINLIKSFKDDQYIYFLLDPALGGTLYQILMEQPDIFSEDKPKGKSSAFCIACITKGLEHLHDRTIAYRDLKPENVLLDSKGYAKICDMGFARFVVTGFKTNTLAGTPEYMAPEMIDFPHAHDMSVDWWALGVLAFELCAGQCPWEDDGIADPHGRLLAIRRSQERANPRYPSRVPSAMRRFIDKLLQPERRRLGAVGGGEEVRLDPWLASMIDFDALCKTTLKSPYVPPPFQCPDDPDERMAPYSESLFTKYRPDPHVSKRWTQNFAAMLQPR